MWWILVWALLLVAAAAAVGLLGWRLVRQVLALGRELGTSAGRVSDAMAAMHAPDRAAAPSSVFLDPDAQPSVQPRTRGTARR